jgi:hypothetical protein
VSRLRARVDRLAEHVGDPEIWYVDLTSDGDGLAYGPGDLTLTRAELARLPANPRRTIIELVDADEGPR